MPGDKSIIVVHHQPLTLHRFPFQAMGSPCEIQLFAANVETARRGAEAAIADIVRLEARYSRYRDDSLLSDINRVAAQGGSIAVDEETASLLNYAATCYTESAGLFDITSGILRRAWRFEQGHIPDPDHIAALLARIGWHRLRWQPPLLSFPEAGLELDFGGVVKEYAVDRAATLCHAAGLHHGVVNLGGDIKIIGPRADGQPWRIGIKHPRAPTALLETLELHGGALATSGDYERCIVVQGRRYGHILNPHSGWPVQHLAAVSVVAEFCVIAGSAATIAMLKEAQGPTWLASLGLRHRWVDVDGGSGGDLV